MWSTKFNYGSKFNLWLQTTPLSSSSLSSSLSSAGGEVMAPAVSALLLCRSESNYGGS